MFLCIRDVLPHYNERDEQAPLMTNEKPRDGSRVNAAAPLWGVGWSMTKFDPIPSPNTVDEVRQRWHAQTHTFGRVYDVILGRFRGRSRPVRQDQSNG